MIRKFLTYSGLVVLACILLAAVLLLSRLSQFRGRVAELAADGFPVSIADLNQTGSEAGKETVNQLNRLWQPAVSLEKEMWESLPEDYFFDRPADKEMIDTFYELNAAYPDVYPSIEKFAERTEIEINFPGNGQESIEGMMDQAARFRSLGRLLGWRIQIAIAEDRPNDAVEDGIRILRLSRLTAQHPTLIGFLTSKAVEGMGLIFTHQVVSNHQISDLLREQLHTELESLSSDKSFQRALVSERAFAISSMTDSGFLQLSFGGVGYLNTIQSIIKAAEQPNGGIGFDEPSAWQIVTTGWQAAQAVPAFSQAAIANARSQSEIRALRIQSALLSATDIPVTITPEFLVQIGVPEPMTLDPMNGELMIIKRTDDKFQIYSVGSNRIDDGGDTNGMMDFGFAQ